MAATYKDIRRLTGLSLATISKHFNGGNVLQANSELIERAVRDLGYQVNDVARGLRSRRTMTLGVVLDVLNRTFNTTVVAAMEERLREAGYGTIITDSRGNPAAEAEAIRFLLGKMVDGIVIVPVGSHVPGLDAAVARGVPVVAVDRPVDHVAVDAVVIDNQAAVATAVDLLTNAGHTVIGLIAGPEDWYTMRERRRGFVDAMTRATGKAPAPEYLQPVPVAVEAGYDALRELMALPTPPSAVVCANYEFTLGAIMALNEMPGDPAVSFVGFDHLDLARVIRPRPSFVVQPIEEIGTRAAEIILSRLHHHTEDSGAAHTVVLRAHLLVGEESTYRRGLR